MTINEYADLKKNDRIYYITTNENRLNEINASNKKFTEELPWWWIFVLSKWKIDKIKKWGKKY